MKSVSKPAKALKTESPQEKRLSDAELAAFDDEFLQLAGPVTAKHHGGIMEAKAAKNHVDPGDIEQTVPANQ